MDEKTVKATMRSTVGYRGRLYGPGEGIEVPEGLASALKLAPEPTDEPTDEPEQEGEDLDGKSVEELQAMADERKLEVRGTGAQGRVLKADLVKALQG